MRNVAQDGLTSGYIEAININGYGVRLTGEIVECEAARDNNERYYCAEPVIFRHIGFVANTKGEVVEIGSLIPEPSSWNTHEHQNSAA